MNNLKYIIMIFIEPIILSIIAGFLGIFYRNCLKEEGLLLHPLYKILENWVENAAVVTAMIKYKKENPLDLTTYKSLKLTKTELFIFKLKGFIAYPLGYCVYCSTTWISYLFLFLYYYSWEVLPPISIIILNILIVSAVSHVTILILGKYIINNHPDLSNYEN